MSLHLLDTNIWIAIANGEPGAVARFRQFDPAHVAVCSVVKAELMFGARKTVFQLTCFGHLTSLSHASDCGAPPV